VGKIEITSGPGLDKYATTHETEPHASASNVDQRSQQAINMASRAMKRNTQGGKAFKGQKKGGGNFRAAAAAAAADEVLELILLREKKGLEGLSAAEQAALCELQVGRVARKFGNGRMEVLCQDGKSRNCAIRGLLKRKGKCHIDLESLVVVALSVPLDELDDSDDEGHHGGGKVAGAAFKSQVDQGFIVGIFDERSGAQLRKTRINPRLFRVADGAGGMVDDYFDRSGDAGGLDEAAAEAAARERPGHGRKAAGPVEIDLGTDEVDIDAI